MKKYARLVALGRIGNQGKGHRTDKKPDTNTEADKAGD